MQIYGIFFEAPDVWSDNFSGFFSLLTFQVPAVSFLIFKKILELDTVDAQWAF